ncbi:MAG: hypothetical protein Q7S55_05215 [Nanoarchaeota archaeon]|nr:hypothetical protein [Nanoarchaeota archaeon]
MTQEHIPELYRYNTLFIGKEFPGLHILTADSYTLMQEQAPSFPHQNWGDFYSEVPCDDLADKVYQLLDKGGLAEDTVIVPSRLFDEKRSDLSKDYIIKENTGVRIYSPTAHKDPAIDPEAVYALGSLCLWDGLFSTRKEGNFQRDYKENVHKLEAGLKELETASKRLEKAAESLKETLEALNRKLDRINKGEEILEKRRKIGFYRIN